MAQVGSLTQKQKTQLSEALAATKVEPSTAQLVNREFSSDPVCPSCAGKSIYKWGIVSGLQRYRCKDCKRTFNALTGTPLAHLRKKELWETYSQALADSLSLTKAAEVCGIDRTTAFRWRHRFLPQSDEPVAMCCGIVEADETYFRESFKGKKVQHRAARKRGELHVRGLSAEQIPVVVVKDRSGHTCDAVLEERSAREVGLRIGGRIATSSLLCIDRSRILKKFAKDSGLAFELVGAKQRKGREKVFHVQTVNAYHSRLKNWMKRFNGVATERLSNYLTWRRLQEMKLASPQEWLLTIVRGKLHNLRN